MGATFRKRAEAVLRKTPTLDVPEELLLDDLPLACRAYRASGNIGLREAARDMQVSPTTLGRFEQEQNTDMEIVRTVAKWIGVKTLTIKI